MANLGINNLTGKMRNSGKLDCAAPPKIVKYMKIPDSNLFNGYFDLGSSLLYTNNTAINGFDETRDQTIEYDYDNNAATIQTWYKNEKGTEATVDETISISFEETDWGSLRPEITGIDFNIDKNIDYFKQGDSIGDCAFLSSLVSLAKTGKGRNILEDIITINDNKSYSVTFKGIDKTVLITQEELAQARKSGEYSTGDNTVLLLEYAAQKALNELYGEIGVTEDDIINYYTNKADDKTAEKVEKYLNHQNLIDNCLYDESPIAHFSLSKFIQLLGLPNNIRTVDVSRIDESNIKSLLDGINFNDSINVLDFSNCATMISDNGQEFNILTNHAYAITDYNAENGTVTIVNPHNSSDSLTITISELKQYGCNLYVSSLE